jgi:hypothetical protein
VFVHQFRQIAIRLPPPASRERFPGLPVYCYRQRFGSPPAGLAAVKHVQAEDARERACEEARFNANGLARRRQPPLIENEISKPNRPSREELRLAARAAFIADLKLRHMTLAELFQWHLANGTAHIFLESLKHE